MIFIGGPLHGQDHVLPPTVDAVGRNGFNHYRSRDLVVTVDRIVQNVRCMVAIEMAKEQAEAAYPDALMKSKHRKPEPLRFVKREERIVE